MHILGSILMATSSKISMMLLGRVTAGIGTGWIMVAGPLYIFEIAPQHHKTLFGSLIQISVVLGLLLTQSLALVLSTSQGWRVILSVGGQIGALQFLLALFSIESPRYLMLMDKDEAERDASNNLQSTTLFEENLPLNENEIPSQLSVYQFISSRNYRKDLITVSLLMVAHQFTGINAVVAYSTPILSPLIPSFASKITVLSSLVNLTFSILYALIAERYTHRYLLLVSLSCLGTSTFLLALSIELKIRVLAGLLILFFLAGFAIGAGPIGFHVIPDIVDKQVVIAAQGLAFSLNWLGLCIVGYLFPIVRNVIHGWSFMIFWGISMTSIVLIKKYL
ncbi:Vacuolar protein sorting-associated protein 73 [Neolecta irregularis DAH-3]|uniref:Vacuolar protein sorting-associated protein 73 n=1 Tax=Neolecta irregularis (strain DAH-3) TaxID=1198029 RepID=A0A1U7LM79_NEOID|nr:Vacuolar protein sorting-associated protein 73 [Neolecta irregularis DAH-3]|eukprot:OLL23652.1 Vacuolar protein sorting-associated protein 73 [Neolecta irregularis DAH-3]